MAIARLAYDQYNDSPTVLGLTDAMTAPCRGKEPKDNSTELISSILSWRFPPANLLSISLQFRRNSAARLGLAGFGRGCGLVVEQAAGFRQGAFASFAFQTQGHFRVL